MKELFWEDGHLTDEALTALVEGSLNEDQRLEVGEHLSFCDKCLDRYTALLTGEVLEQPSEDQTLPTLRRVRKKQRRLALHRYASAAAAVVLGSVLWYSGVFQAVGESLNQPPESFAKPPVAQQGQTPVRVGDSILQAVNQWSIRVKETTAPAFSPAWCAPKTDLDSSKRMEEK